MKKKVSIIIPVYNVEKYLVQAMESVVNQTYDNYEIICIDDGSTDESGCILDRYSNNNKVKIIHKNNTGYGNTMNVGLSEATGDYIAILEPDDYIENNTLESIMKVIDTEGDLDIVKCNFSFIKGEESLEVIPTKVLKDSSKYGRVLEGDEILSLYFGYIAHWTAIYRKEFLNKHAIRYNESPGASYQDIGMWFQTAMYAQKVYLLDEYFYNYRVDNPGSSMNNFGKVFCTCDEYDFIETKISSEMQKRILPYYVKCRLISVKDTYRRIAKEHRKAFLCRVASDFQRVQSKGLLDISRLSSDERELLNKLMSSYENLWMEKENECNKFLHYVNELESFYIYGAGNLATFIYRLLPESERKKLKGFLVTTSNGEKKIADKPVMTFESVKYSMKDQSIIIGVSDLYANEIQDYLRKSGINDSFVFKGGIV